MDCQGPLTSRLRLPAGLIVAGLIVAALVGLASAPARGDEPAPPPESRPYRVRAVVRFDAAARVDPARGAEFVADWVTLARRTVGAAWSIEARVDDGGPDPAAGWPVDAVPVAAMKELTGPADKGWLIEVHPDGRGLSLLGREYDAATGSLGQVHRRTARFVADAPRGLLDLALAMFAPVAEVGAQEAGGVTFRVRGGALPPAGPGGALVGRGSVFRVLRIFEPRPGQNGGAPEIREVPYSYFAVEKLDGASARCRIIRGVSDPLSGRFARPNRLVALGIKPAENPTRLRFVHRADKRAASGYVLTARGPDEPRATEVATTDRDGRVVLPPGFASGLAILRLMAGSVEPVVEFPVMPGETDAERVIPVESRPATLALEARLDALRDSIVDVVASRSRLELRMKARADGEDWDGLAEAIAEFRKLTPRDRFETQLNALFAEGERQEAERKSLVLTKNARAQFEDTRSLIGRYLDDDKARAYEDLLAQGRAEAAKAKAAPKAKVAPAPVSLPAANPAP